MSMDRREFVKGALAAGTLAVGGTLAACTPSAASNSAASSAAASTSSAASSSASSKPTGRWSWSIPPDPIPDDKISETYDCDICVVGAGVAGISTSLYAAEKGQKVVVLQKDPHISVNGQSMGAWNHPAGDAAGIVWDNAATMQHYADISDGKNNLKLFRNYLIHSGEALDYINQYAPVGADKPKPTIATLAGAYGYQHLSCSYLINGDFLTRYTGWRMFNEALAEKAQEFGATYLYSTPAEQLVTDSSGAVVGVIGKDEDGKYVKVNAKNVILCTGDLTSSEEMKEAYFPMLVGRPTLHTSKCNTGDGQKMGMWVGASFDNAPAGVMLHYDPSPLSFPAPPMSAAPWLHVNIFGERFCNEYVGYQASATAVSAQPEFRAYQVIDSHFMENLDYYKNGFRRGTLAVWEQCVNEGSILKADTLEELAKLAGFPVDTFLATVKRYNELVDKGVDEDFGSAVIQYNGIKDPPFYTIQRMPAVLVSGLGLTCNEFGQVMSKEFKPIKGLYAAGNTQGSFYGYDYPVEGFGGTGIGRCITLGIMDVMHILGTHGQKIE